MRCRSKRSAWLLGLCALLACSDGPAPVGDVRADAGPGAASAAARDGGPSRDRPDAGERPGAGPAASPIARPVRVDTRDCQLPGTRRDSLPRGELLPVDVEPFEDAVAIAPIADGFLVAQRGGPIVRVSRTVDGGDYTRTLLGDLASRGTLHGLAVSPAGLEQLFVHYVTAESPPRSVIARFDVAPGTATLVPASERIVAELRYRDADAARFGGALLFDDAGMLIAGIGDGGELAVDYGDAQDPQQLSGKLLRFDVSALDGGAAAPAADNPFIDDPDARPEVFASGLRDPRACALHPDTRELFCVDAGERDSELNLVRAGDDLGWPERDGNFCVAARRLCLDDRFVRPLVVHGRDGAACGAVGVAFQTGDGPGPMAGIAFHGDGCGRWLSGYRASDAEGSRQGPVVRAGDALAAVGRDERGRLLVIDRAGDAFTLALAPDGTPGSFPERLSETGCYADMARFEPAAEMIAYEVASPLWSDGSHKRRWLAVPTGTRIEAPVDGPWAFPEGSILMKEFAFALASEPERVRPVETRFMHKRDGRWEFHGYRWNDDASEAELIFEHAVVRYETTSGAQDYQFPDRSACSTCHGDAPGLVLGPRTAQLNMQLRYEDGLDDQLRVLAALDLLSGMDAAVEPAGLPALASPADDRFTLEERARSYLHANCAHCHQPGGWTPPDLTLDLRYDRTLAQTAACDVPNQYIEPDRMRIAPGAPDASTLLTRMLDTGLDRMPPVATTVVDPLGTRVVRDWITQLRCE